jgi:hypothetical protein
MELRYIPDTLRGTLADAVQRESLERTIEPVLEQEPP